MGRSPEAAASGAGSIGETKQFDPIRHEQRNFMASTERFTSYSAYRESRVEWLGEIPAHWTCLSLARVTQSRCDGPFGSGLKSQHYSVDGVRVIRLQNIGGSEFLNSDQVFVDESHADALGDHSVLQGDLLVAGLGDDAQPVGRACVAPEGLGRVMVKADCFRFRLDLERVVPDFAAYQLSANALAASGYLATGSTRSRINLSTTATRKIALPPVAEQHSIVSFLNCETEKFDAMVTKKERLIEFLYEKRTALIIRMITKGIDPDVPMKDSGVEWFGEIPENWDVGPLYARYEVALGKMLDAKRISGSFPGRYLRNVDVQWDSVNTKDLPTMDFSPQERDRFGLQLGDVLVCEGGEVGRTAMWRGSAEECFYQKAIHRVRPKSKRDVPRFFFYLMCVLSAKGVFVAEGNPNTINHLTATQLRHYRVVFPPGHQQRAIAAYLDRETTKIDALVAKVREAIDRLKELRTALISAAVTGKIDVRDVVP